MFAVAAVNAGFLGSMSCLKSWDLEVFILRCQFPRQPFTAASLGGGRLGLHVCSSVCSNAIVQASPYWPVTQYGVVLRWYGTHCLLDPSDGVFGRFDLAALGGCHTLNVCYVMLCYGGRERARGEIGLQREIVVEGAFGGKDYPTRRPCLCQYSRVRVTNFVSTQHIGERVIGINGSCWHPAAGPMCILLMIISIRAAAFGM